jgi:hypothetical protein
MFVDYARAVINRLKGDAVLMRKVHAVAEAIPDGTGFPFIWIEDGGQVDWSTKSTAGVQAEVTLHIASRYNGNAEIRRIQNDVHRLLHEAALSATPSVLLCRFDRANIVTEQDGQTRHGVMRFKLTISG